MFKWFWKTFPPKCVECKERTYFFNTLRGKPIYYCDDCSLAITDLKTRNLLAMDTNEVKEILEKYRMIE